ncbi:MAG: nitronate monooxygenase [Syntrophales bacterium]|jgi:NAD(P)H-dependent flavin oxidoreductase YrpB (nitropropane dioxygenase family)|nr:nitronate monooxygenase [Syntrophales bacterium]
MKFKTELCEMLNIDYPIMLAGMANVATAELVAAVSNAGGIGVLGCTYKSLDWMVQEIRKVRSLTDKPFGVDIILPAGTPPNTEGLEFPEEHIRFVNELKERMNIPDETKEEWPVITMEYIHKQVKIVLEEKIPLFVTGLGNPGFMISDAHVQGMKVAQVVGNVKNARRAADVGVDFIIAAGHEAGGHTSRIGTLALIPQVVDAVDVPVVAGGGIGDSRGLVAALALGAVGVWVGTRFIATREAWGPLAYKQKILESTEEDTVITKSYTGKTMRAIRNKWTDAWAESGLPALPMHLQLALVRNIRQASFDAGRVDVMTMPAGQIIGMIKELKTAKEVLEEMVQGASKILTQELRSRISLV